MTPFSHVLTAVVNNVWPVSNRQKVKLVARRIPRRLSATISRTSSRALSVFLIICLLTTSTPAASETAVSVANEWQATFGFWLRGNGLPAKLYRSLKAQDSRPQPQEQQEGRDAEVSRIKIFPGDIKLQVDEKVVLAAVAYDSNGTPIGGVNFRWTAWDEGRKHQYPISPQGDFEAHLPGTFNVTATGANQKEQVTINVLDVKERVQKHDNKERDKAISTRDLAPPSEIPAYERLQHHASKSSNIVPVPAVESAPAAKKRPAPNAILTPVMPLAPGDGGWDPANYYSADDPPNRRGQPPGAPLDGGAGSSNFQFSTSVLGLPGRGMGISMALAGNSRMWNKSGNQLNYDVDRDWPAPGFTLGFGKLLGIAGGSMIVDADGTRHGFTGTISQGGTYFTGHTTDGSLIDYWHQTNSGGWILYGQAKLANGTIIDYGANGPGGVFPTRITDPNGNYITVTYVNNAGPQLQTVTDTLGRVITFSYDQNNLLTAITAPRLNDGTCTPGQPCTRTLVRLHYKHQPLSYDFPGKTVVVRDANPWVIDAIYYPGTSSGYWFGDSNSYSTYGMLAKVMEQRGMGFAANSLNEQGTVTPGQVNWKEVYNYPLYVGDGSGTPSTGLSDAPTYTSMTRSWTRDGTPGNDETATTGYLVQDPATNALQPTIPSRKVQVTQPNGSKSIQYSYNYTNLADSNPLKALDGIVYQEETRDSAGTLLKLSASTWEKGAYDAARPLRIEATDERSQTKAVSFDYTGGSYNQTTKIRTYDYNGTTVLTSVATQYQNSSDYTGRHIFNLPVTVETFTGDGLTRVSKTDYLHDAQPLTARPNVTQHDQSFNPNADAEGYCYFTPDWNDPDCSGWQCNQLSPSLPNMPGCDGYCPDIYICPYNPATDFRGNVSQITTYANVTNGSATGATVEIRDYDVTGNVVKVSNGSGQQTTFAYGTEQSPLATQYAYVLSTTTGSATDIQAQVTSSTTYDFNTALPLSTIDPNGRATQSTYDANTLRPQRLTLPTGSHTDYSYDDSALTFSASTYLGSHPADTGLADQTVKLFNGIGDVRQEKALGANGVWDYLDINYDNMARVSQQGRPYRSGDPPQWTTPTYDALSRVISQQAPDGSTTQTFFNESNRPSVASNSPGETTRIKDAWGRERWGRIDALGRLVEVVEPNPAGSGSVLEAGAFLTTYAYDTEGNLTNITQNDPNISPGTQTRSFKYDSLGRVVAQKMAETSAALNDSGAYVGVGGPGAQWSDYIKYDLNSNVVQRTDARGVKTKFWYFDSQGHTDPADGTLSDPLNRLQSVSYDTSDDPNHGLQPGNPNYYLRVLDAASVNYHYRTRSSASDLKDVTQPDSITAAGISTESYLYDPDGRVGTKTVSFNNRSSYPMITDYVYDNLGRLKDVYYPGKDLFNNSARKHLEPLYDVAGRLTQLTVDGQLHAGSVDYNAASQATSLKVGVNGPNQITENYSFEAPTGLPSGQTVVRGSGGSATTLLNLSYQYVDANNKRSGQLTKILNNLNHNKDRGFRYDALGRLVQATGGPSGTFWNQNYAYDRWGNRTSVSASGNSAKAGSLPGESPTETTKASGSTTASNTRTSSREVARGSAPANPKVVLPTDELAAKLEVDVPDSLRTELHSDTSRPVSDSSFYRGAPTSRSAPLTPQGGPPAFTDDPLVVGVTQIKAVHVTELRNAVNQARALGGLAAASWTDASPQNVTIKAVHITELRARLAEARAALGLSVASYTDANLTAGATVKAVHIQELRQRSTEALTGPAGCPPGQNLLIDQFVKNVYQGALNRQPNSTELQAWTSQLRQAYYQGQTQLRAAAQYLARQLFKSQEYLNRGRSDHEFVYDLYKAYLQRDPDQGGWDFWTGQVPVAGRDSVREDFANCPEFAAKVASLCPGATGGSEPMPLDGLANLSYEAASNRITTAGFQYDNAGNQTRKVRADGSGQRFQYDAANRLVNVLDDYAYTLATYTYGDTNERLMAEESGRRTYYASESGSVFAEYIENGGSTTPVWSKSYIYLGERLLSTIESNGAGGEILQHHHPDRLGTRLVTNPSAGTSFEQVALPFGTPLNAESTGATNRRFTSYERSDATGLDYAVNRQYDSQQGRFTQVDPAGMSATDLESPQTLNLYAYCANDPVNRSDPSGLGFFSWLKKAFKWIVAGLAVVAAVLTIIYCPVLFATTFKAALGIIAALANAASQVLGAIGLKKASAIFGIISAAASFGLSMAALYAPQAIQKGGMSLKNIFKAIQDGASLASKILTEWAHKKLGQIFDLVSSAAGFISTGFKAVMDPKTKKEIPGQFKFHLKPWEIYKFARSAAEKIATIAGADRVSGFLNVAGFAEDAYTMYRGMFHFNDKDKKLGDDAYERIDNHWLKQLDADRVLAINKQIRLAGRVDRLGTLAKRVNTAFGRVDKVLTLAH